MNARKILNYITLLAVFISFLSCKKENPKQLCGVWSIDKMLCNGKRCDQLLLINTITFNCSENLVKLNGFDKSDDNAIWKLTQGNGKNIMEIKSEIPVYNSRFNISLNKLDNGQLHLKLTSNKLQISAFKIIDEL